MSQRLRRLTRTLTVATLCLSATSYAQAQPGLEIYWIDVEGGAATLVITPSRTTLFDIR